MATREKEERFLTVRIPAADYAALGRLARTNERTVAGEVRLAIRSHLAKSKETR